MIEIKNLNKTFKNNKLNVINDTSLTLPDKGLITLLGESGSGKTTLLNVIGGLDKFDKGSIKYDDTEFNRYVMSNIDKYRNNNISYIFQNYYLIDELSIYDNLKKALEIINITDNSEIEKRIYEALNAVKLYKYRKKKVDSLSGGQRQRVAIARALVKRNKLIIADEPTGNLDSENSINIMNILKEISKSNLVLLVTHNKNLANFYSDYIYNIKDGSIIEGYTPIKGSLNVDDNNVYLKDLTKDSLKDDTKEVTIYNKQDSDIKLELICINGTYYINSNKPIKLLNSSNIKVIDAKREEYDRSKEEISYDPSKFNDIYDKRVFIKFLKSIKESFKNFSTNKKKTKFFRFALFLIGVLTGVLVSVFVYLKTPDMSKVKSRSNLTFNDYNLVTSHGKNANDDNIVKLYKENHISGLSPNKTIDISYESDYFLTDNSITVNYLNDFVNKDNIICGNKEYKSSSDLVITKGLAKELNPNIPFDKFIGRSLGSSNLSSDNKIIGVTDSDEVSIFYKETQSLYDFRPDIFGGKIKFCNEFRENVSGDLYVSYFSYDVFVVDDINVLIPYLQFDNGKSIDSLSDDTIINVNNYPDDRIRSIFWEDLFDNNISCKTIYCNETDYNKSDNIFKRCNPTIYIMTSNAFDKVSGLNHLNRYDKKFVFVADDFALKNYESFINVRQKELRDATKANSEEIQSILIGLGCLSLVMVIYIYFTEHAKLIANIKKVGILRAIGQSKKSIALSYGAEALVESLLTTTLGYVLVGIVYSIGQWVFNTFTSSKMKFVIFNGYFYLGIICIIFIFAIFGALPSLILMKKTPSEIIAKYDI